MLASLEGFATARLERLDAPARATAAADLEAFSETILARADLRAALTDTATAPVARGGVVGELLRDKVGAEARALCEYAASSVPAPEVPHAIEELAHAAREASETGQLHHSSLGLLDARRRVAGFADALLDDVDTETFSSIEDDLFRWARTIEGNVEIRRLLLDRDAPLAARLGLTSQLLEGKVHPVALALSRFVVVGGRPRDVVGTLDFLVNYVARARDWRVARVFTARRLDDATRAHLVGSLSALTGKNVELHVAEEPALLSGVLVEIGDLRVDATTRGRLGALRDAVTSGRGLGSPTQRNE